MKKIVLLTALVASLPFTSMAQDDDLYFNPKQEAKKEAAAREKLIRDYKRQRAIRDSIYAANWTGSTRSVDEYNRNGRILSHYQNIESDSLGNDIISFRWDNGVHPDSIYDDAAFVQKYINQDDEEFGYTRNMSRWDGYYDPWFNSYYGVGPYYWRSRYWGWRNPWRYGYYAGWYDPWYDPFYDPWYYGYAGWYGGWHDPWYGGWYGYPVYWNRPVVAVGYHGNPRGLAGNRSWNAPRKNGSSWGSQDRNNGYTYRSNSNRSFGGRVNPDNTNTRSNSNNNTNFNGFGNRSGNFGGGRSGGGSFGGGGRSGGGGGHFGGRR